ncbi:hypothetical protein [Streptomyces sp. IBSBF 2435]|uniref:hypothetical protein n=1 Tax=Streptomyces sp. IBSBF 2435 TaxID=2903531 RepID=UPI002FDC6332
MPVDLPTWGPQRLPVPYAAVWSGERRGSGGALVVRPRGLAYRDETPADRDRHGVLWARVTEEPGAGRPDFGAMHPVRQRAAMLGLRCQVCGGPAGRTSRGWLFVLPDEPAAREPEGALTTKPPLCSPCADLALRHCPHLRTPLATRSRKPRVWGVFGELFAPGTEGPAHFPYAHPATPWLLATQVVLQLTRCTPADLTRS